MGEPDRGPLERAGCAVSGDAEIADLDALAAELGRRDCDARVLTPPARRPCLHAASAARQVEYVYAGGGWYWWAWAERIAETTDVAGAAGAVMAALRPAGER